MRVSERQERILRAAAELTGGNDDRVRARRGDRARRNGARRAGRRNACLAPLCRDRQPDPFEVTEQLRLVELLRERHRSDYLLGIAT
jgi:hypothetical protein